MVDNHIVAYMAVDPRFVLVLPIFIRMPTVQFVQFKTKKQNETSTQSMRILTAR